MNTPLPADRVRRIFGIHPLKVVFAMEYVLQGLANPFLGATYQPFFRHFRFDYGLSEAATQNLFAKSYLAWSFKPLIGFLMDAYGRTRTALIGLLGAAVLGYLLAPLFDVGPMVFFGSMFALCVVLAATDVAVDRATVIAGDEEARTTGRSKATTVGLNQAICWTAIYGTMMVSAVLGGYLAEHVRLSRIMVGLALMPLAVLGAVLFLPRDRAAPMPLMRSIRAFWSGLNSGPILGIMLFYFVFHFQPALGPLWNNYLIETLGFNQAQVGVGDGASYAGSFAGVLLFAWKGVRWQERLGLRKIFGIYILMSIGVHLIQYLQVEPWFSAVARALHQLVPFWQEKTARLLYLCSYNALLALVISLTRMTTFSLVGAVIPVAAAGSLFAGFMSIANLAYSFSYASAAWLYDHGTEIGALRATQEMLFGLPGKSGDKLSMSMLIVLNSAAYALSFIAVRLLPDRRATVATGDLAGADSGAEARGAIGSGLRRSIDVLSVGAGIGLLLLAALSWGLDFVSATLMSFFAITMLRKAALTLLSRRPRASA